MGGNPFEKCCRQSLTYRVGVGGEARFFGPCEASRGVPLRLPACVYACTQMHMGVCGCVPNFVFDLGEIKPGFNPVEENQFQKCSIQASIRMQEEPDGSGHVHN